MGLLRNYFAAMLMASAVASAPVFAQQAGSEYAPTYYGPAQGLDEVQVKRPATLPVTSTARNMRIATDGPRVSNTGSLKIVGLWVGNMSYKVGQDDAGRLYTIAPDGTRKALAEGTNVNDVAVAQDNPIISGLIGDGKATNAQPDPKGPKFVVGQRGLLQPKVIGTRSMVVDGKPVIVGGAIISELPGWGTTNSASYARVIKKQTERKTVSKRKVRKINKRK